MNENIGFRRRQEKIARSRPIKLLGRLYIDMCEQKQLREIKKMFVKFSDDLKFIFNLDKSEYHRMSLVKSIGPVYDINADYSVLYVYTSLIADQIVGDTRAPLLRLVCTGKNKQSNTSYRAFPHVQYLPLKFHQFETISVHIRDRLGKKVSLQSGQVVLTVKFRPLRLL